MQLLDGCLTIPDKTSNRAEDHGGHALMSAIDRWTANAEGTVKKLLIFKINKRLGDDSKKGG